MLTRFVRRPLINKINKRFNSNINSDINNSNTNLLQEVKEIEYHEFKLEEFNDVKTSDNYIIFYKLIQID